MFAEVSGMKIYYLRKGKGKKLLFIHGLFADSSLYAGLIEELSENFEVFAPDLPGHGLSDGFHGRWPEQTMTKALVGFAGKMGLENPVVCGHSAGAALAVLFSEKHRCRALILLSPPTPLNPLKFGFRFFFVKAFVDFFQHPVLYLRLLRAGFRNFARLGFSRFFWLAVFRNLQRNFAAAGQNCLVVWPESEEVFWQARQTGRGFMVVPGTHDWPLIEPARIRPVIRWLLHRLI